MRGHLQGYRSNPQDDHRLFGWSIGTVSGMETLVQARPMVQGLDADPIDDLLRTPTACTVAIFSSGHKADSAPRDVVRTARFPRWVAVETGTPLDEPLRQRLRSGLPDFLGRDAQGKTNSEMLLLGFMAALYRRGGFGTALAPPQIIREALRELRSQITGAHRTCNLFVSDGRTLGVLHEDGVLLAFQPPASATTREFQVTPGRARGARATVLIWTREREAAPGTGGERVGPGVFSISSPAPMVLARD